jgi:hypothetical protein
VRNRPDLGSTPLPRSGRHMKLRKSRAHAANISVSATVLWPATRRVGATRALRADRPDASDNRPNAGAAMAQEELELGRPMRHVQGLQGRADIARGEIGQKEFEPVRQLRRDHIAAPDVELVEEGGERRGAPMQLRIGETGLADADRDAIRHRRGAALDPVEQCLRRKRAMSCVRAR